MYKSFNECSDIIDETDISILDEIQIGKDDAR